MRNKEFLILFLSVTILSACGVRQKKVKNEEEVLSLEKREMILSSSDVPNLKSYYLSAVCTTDSLVWLYGYNNKAHALDCFALNGSGAYQIPLQQDGPSGVARPVYDFSVCSPDSIWVYDASQRILLLDSSGAVVRTVCPKEVLKPDEYALVGQNFQMATDKFYYDARHASLLWGARGEGGFKVYEQALDGGGVLAEYVLQPSVVVGDVYAGGYANMNKPNITFTEKYVLYNYPVESSLYVLDRSTKKTRVVKADSRYTENVASKCNSEKDYAQWERHGIENPHFYEVRYVQDKDMYVRLHTGGQDFDVSRSLFDMISDKRLYLTVFDGDFAILGEFALEINRYNPATSWCTTSDRLLLFVYNALYSDVQDEKLVLDVLNWSYRE